MIYRLNVSQKGRYMTVEERDKLYQYDKEKRRVIIKRAIMMGLNTSKDKLSFANTEETKKFFQDRYNEYSGNMLTQEEYKPADFWFNDAGFHFKWRNFESNIQLESLPWNEVIKQIKQITQ